MASTPSSIFLHRGEELIESLKYKNCDLASLLDPLTWTQICPFLTCNILKEQNADMSSVDVRLILTAGEHLQNRGYFQIKNSQLTFSVKHANIIALLAEGVMQLGRYGYSPMFLLMFNEATRCLSEGVITSPALLDLALIYGIGFPPYRGGILRYADHVGLKIVHQKLAFLSQVNGENYAPTEILLEKVATNSNFYHS